MAQQISSNRLEYNKIQSYSYSQLSNALCEVEDYVFWIENRNKQTKSLTTGSAFHALLEETYSENKAYSEKYIEFDESIFGESLNDEGFRRKKEYQDWKKQASEMAIRQSKELCDMTAKQMLNANITLLDAALKGKGFIFETSLLSADGKTKGIIDTMRINCDTVNIIDTKTTRDEFHGTKYGKPNALKIILDWDYDLQAYIYTRLAKEFYGLEKARYFWLIAGTTEPYKVGVFECSNELMESGRMKFEKAVSNIEKWEKTGFKRTELEIITL